MANEPSWPSIVGFGRLAVEPHWKRVATWSSSKLIDQQRGDLSHHSMVGGPMACCGQRPLGGTVHQMLYKTLHLRLPLSFALETPRHQTSSDPPMAEELRPHETSITIRFDASMQHRLFVLALTLAFFMSHALTVLEQAAEIVAVEGPDDDDVALCRVS